MSSQRPFFLSSFLAAFRPQGPAIQSTTSQQPNKHHAQPSSSPSSASHHHHPYSTSAVAAAAAASSQSRTSAQPIPSTSVGSNTTTTHPSSVAIHSPRGTSHNIPIPGSASNRRRGSDSSSEGFRDVIGADKWYIGGRTAGGEEKFFKLGVVRRIRSNDGLSLDRLSL